MIGCRYLKNKIKKWLGISEIEDVLTREGEKKEDNLHLGSEIDGKVEQKDFDSLKRSFDDLKKRLAKPQSFYDTFSSFSYSLWFDGEKQPEPEVVSLEEKFDILVKHLGLEFKKEEKKIKGYRKIIKKKSK